ncbi:MAG: tail fiber protein [Bryobacteraceae bacterium]|jgi:microcystin-dependent protein
MSEPFLSEIKIMSFNFPPKGWAFCDGQLMAINQNQALFALVGTTYGGDGQVNFRLPNLQGLVPVHFGGALVLGEMGGEQAHTLIISEVPAHAHTPVGTTTAASSATPANNLWCSNPANPFNATAGTPMTAASIGATGGSQPHLNMSPFLVLNFCIALQGIFPSQD